LKIIHVVHSYFPKIGGIERAVQYLAEEQARLGHDVTVITSNIDVADSPKEETINEVKVVRLKSRRPLYNDLTIPLEEPPIKDVDIIHAHSQNSLFSIIVAERLKAKGGGKVAFHFMAVEVFKSHPNFLIRLLAPYYGKEKYKEGAKARGHTVSEEYQRLGDLEGGGTALKPSTSPTPSQNTTSLLKRLTPTSSGRSSG